jgi:hypothetical protein
LRKIGKKPRYRIVKTIPIKAGVVKTIPMNAAQHAARILTAWNGADPLGFERELDHALYAAAGAAPADLLNIDLLEYERRELLNSVVERLRGREKSPACRSLNAGFVLLEHLSARAATA